MMKKNNGQIDVFDHMIFDKLIPKDHLLIKIDSILDFSFVYDKVKDTYSKLGRGSKDPVMMIKILLLEYLYNLSDVAVSTRIKTDIAFRWFLGLSILISFLNSDGFTREMVFIPFAAVLGFYFSSVKHKFWADVFISLIFVLILVQNYRILFYA